MQTFKFKKLRVTQSVLKLSWFIHKEKLEKSDSSFKNKLIMRTPPPQKKYFEPQISNFQDHIAHILLYISPNFGRFKLNWLSIWLN